MYADKSEILHGFPNDQITSRIQYRILSPVSKALPLPQNISLTLYAKPSSSTSARVLRSTNLLELIVPSVWTALAHCRVFSAAGPLPQYEQSSCLVFLSQPLALCRCPVILDPLSLSGT